MPERLACTSYRNERYINTLIPTYLKRCL